MKITPDALFGPGRSGKRKTQDARTRGNGEAVDRRTQIVLENRQRRKSAGVATLRQKLERGEKLTAKELQYLKEQDPAAYNEAVELLRERAEYEERLRRMGPEAARETHQLTIATLQNGEANPARTAQLQAAYEDYLLDPEGTRSGILPAAIKATTTPVIYTPGGKIKQ